ncbi:MAG: hypothetical protein WCO16_02360 [bacterium]
MIKNTILGTLAVAFALTATVASAEGTTTRPIKKLENRIENRAENRMNASTTRPLLRDRGNASSTKMVDSVCAKTAVDVRKASLVSIYGTFSSSMSSALSAREDAVKASFDQTTKKTRQDARTAARTNYRKSVKAAFETLRTAEKGTVKTYANSIKACGGTNSEASNEASDGSIADSILK